MAKKNTTTRRRRKKRAEPEAEERVIRYIITEDEEGIWGIPSDLEAMEAERVPPKPKWPEAPPGVKTYSTGYVAEKLGVIKGTIYKYFREGLVEDVKYRDRYGNRQFTEEDVERLVEFRKSRPKGPGKLKKTQ